MTRLRVATCLLAAALAGAASPPPPAPVETQIEAPGPAGKLAGTLLRPAGPATAPVILIIPGSGPTDRDGNNSRGVKAATYRMLAEALAARGITTARIDKRGMFGSKQAVPDANAVTIPDYVTDVHNWVTVLRHKTGAPCVWLFGHSEGGLVALAAGAQQPDVCGLILAASIGRPMGEVLRTQLKANPANQPILQPALSAIDSLEAGKRVDAASLPQPLMGLFRPQVQGFLISAFSYDPAKLIAASKKPVLILQGERDLQILQTDAQALKKAQPAATLVLLPDVNHVLKVVHFDSKQANLIAYGSPDTPIAPAVVDAVAGFVRK